MNGRQFLDVHLESAVAGDAEDASVGFGQLHADGGRQGEPHRAQSTGGDESSGRGRTIALRGPHLMQAHGGDDDAFFRQTAEQFVEKTNRGLSQPARVELGPVRTTSLRAPGAEVREWMPPQFSFERRNRLRQISHHCNFAGTHAIELRGIDFEVNDLGVRRKPRRIAGDAIVEPRSKDQ